MSVLKAMATVLPHLFRRRDTVLFPEERPLCPPRYRGRIVLTRDPAGGERCVACYLCAVACPVDCIALQATEDETGRRYPEWFRINFSRCIFCGFCEEACPTKAIQLTPDFDMNEYHRARHGLREGAPADLRARASTTTTTSTGWPGWPSAARTRARPRTRTPPVDLRADAMRPRCGR